MPRCRILGGGNTPWRSGDILPGLRANEPVAHESSAERISAIFGKRRSPPLRVKKGPQMEQQLHDMASR